MAQRVTLAVPDPANPGQDINVGTAALPIQVSGGGSSSSPGIAGGEYNSTPPTLLNGQTDALQLSSRGSLLTSLTDSVGNLLASQTGGADAQPATRGIQTGSFVFEFNGATWDRKRKPNGTSRIVSSAATTNPTVAKASAGDMYRVSGYNTNAAARYLKLYNKATAPTVGTDIPVWTEYLAPQAKFDLSIAAGMYFSAGISYALVTGSADSDATAVGAGDILGLNLAYA